jgi:uncharacterized protein YvpB
MKLKVPCFKQKKLTCGPTSLQQVLAYYRKKISLNEILKNIKMFKYGTWTGYLGICAIKLGFKAKLVYYNVNYIDPTWFGLSRNRLIKKLEVLLRREKRKKRKEGITSLLEYLKAGGEIIFQIPSESLLLDCLKKKIPPIVCLSSTILYKRKRFDFKKNKRSEYGEPFGHFIVVSGYENGKFIVTDPHQKYGGVYKVPEDKFIFAWLFLGGDCLIIEPK